MSEVEYDYRVAYCIKGWGGVFYSDERSAADAHWRTQQLRDLGSEAWIEYREKRPWERVRYWHQLFPRRLESRGKP